MEPMLLALEEARKALDEGEIPVGAVLMRGEEVLWADHNRREQTGDPTAHAEILCLRKGARKTGDWRLSGCDLYVTLEPCPMCAGALVMARIDTCVYGAVDPACGCCGSVYDLPADPALHSSVRWRSGVMAEDCAALLGTFFARKRENSPNKEQKSKNESAPSRKSP